MKTVGLDFGTHQTKICIEDKNRTETHYNFHKFVDLNGEWQYTLPSIICITPDRKLKYGFVEDVPGGIYKRYFKQAVYRDTNSPGITLWEAARYSIWYLAYILFELKSVYGKEDFNIQMGAPSDSSGIDDRRAIAVSIMASAYKLVEDVFRKDRKAFLGSSYEELVKLTEIVPYSEKLKRIYGIWVFPEAYACLMPLVGRGKIAHGMNLVVDIGGGTTDISFFTIEEMGGNSKKYYPQVYDFFSLNKGLNYLTEANKSNHLDILEMIQFFSEKEIDKRRLEIYMNDIQHYCNDLIKEILNLWKLGIPEPVGNLLRYLKNRPIVYTGGGSSIKELQSPHDPFIDQNIISYDTWKSKEFDDKSMFENPSLCPVLSTAYGLSISVSNDTIEKSL